MAKLCVNIDHVATVRQARLDIEPDPVHAAVLAELAGAHGITVHLREDRRHIQDRDLEILRKTVKTKLNMEMAVTASMVAKALSIKPDEATLVPEKRQELTTEGGLDVVKFFARVKKAARELGKAGITVSLFIDPDFRQIEAAKRSGAAFIELHTGVYANSKDARRAAAEMERLTAAAEMAQELGLSVNAGHGLTYRNVGPVAAIKGIEDLNIGHNIIARSVLVGMERAVREMLEAMNR